MTIEQLLNSLEINGNLTHMVLLWCSLYSISASARAVFSTGDHITGFEP